MRSPPFAQSFESRPPVVRLKRDCKQLPHFSVKICESGGRMGERPDGKLALSCQSFGKQTEHHTLSCAWVAADKREAALAHQAVFDAPAEAIDLAGLQQRLGG